MPAKKSTPAPQEHTHWIWDVVVLWPFIWIALLFIILPLIGFSLSPYLSQFEEPPIIFFTIIPIFFLVHFASIVLLIVAYIYAIHRLYTRTNLDNDEKRMWLILLVIFNIFTVPILHFMHLRK
jgi:hypothetical protein